MHVALVHDWLNQQGGAELVLQALRALYPEAPIYTAMYAPELMPRAYRDWPIRTSYMQRLPGIMRHHQVYLPLYPGAFERFDLSAYDLVISNSSGFCHGVLTRPDASHINYCLTPPRYLWNLPQYLARERIGVLGRLALPFLVSRLRVWDYVAAGRVDAFIGISRAVVARIRKYYRREAALIWPPVETSRFRPAPPAEVGDNFLVVSRLVPYKRVDLAVRACTKLNLPLAVVGDGRDRAALEALAGPTVRFLGRQPDAEVARLMARCRAFLFPGEEDFGIAPIEAQAAGRPVIAYAGGGALETIRDGQTGRFFREPTVASLAQALQGFQAEGDHWQPAAIAAHAAQFDTAHFHARFRAFVAAQLAAMSSSALLMGQDESGL